MKKALLLIFIILSGLQFIKTVSTKPGLSKKKIFDKEASIQYLKDKGSKIIIDETKFPIYKSDTFSKVDWNLYNKLPTLSPDENIFFMKADTSPIRPSVKTLKHT